MSDLNISVLAGKVSGQPQWEGSQARFTLLSSIYNNGAASDVPHNVVLTLGDRTSPKRAQYIQDNLVDGGSATIQGTDHGNYKAVTSSGLSAFWKPKAAAYGQQQQASPAQYQQPAPQPMQHGQIPHPAAQQQQYVPAPQPAAYGQQQQASPAQYQQPAPQPMQHGQIPHPAAQQQQYVPAPQPAGNPDDIPF